MDIRIDWEAFGAGLGVLFIFGLLYNYYIAISERNSGNEGATAIQVAAGTFVVLVVLNIVRYYVFVNGLIIESSHAAEAALLSLATDITAFIAAGTPMIVGYWHRYTERRRNTSDHKRQIELAKILEMVDQETENDNDETA